MDTEGLIKEHLGPARSEGLHGRLLSVTEVQGLIEQALRIEREALAVLAEEIGWTEHNITNLGSNGDGSEHTGDKIAQAIRDRSLSNVRPVDHNA